MTRSKPQFQLPNNSCCNLVPRACDPWEGNEGSGIIRCRKPGILAKIELRIHFNGQSESSLKRIIPEPSFPSRGSQARGTRLQLLLINFIPTFIKHTANHCKIDNTWIISQKVIFQLNDRVIRPD